MGSTSGLGRRDDGRQRCGSSGRGNQINSSVTSVAAVAAGTDGVAEDLRRTVVVSRY
ncbi:hypothetical protein AB0M46_25305 [Dactylosporangium sp. NPDC051485]|uniref:hypothetical protein n=1 Tax=Dactylosporangium sp. NPDC051485 TaxID=3154846 RepID=UPI0034238A0E